MYRDSLSVIADAFVREASQCWQSACEAEDTHDPAAVPTADRLSRRATRLAVAAGYLRSRAARPEKTV